MTIDPSLTAKLRDALSRGPPLRLAVLFGSQVTGRARPGSDFDVGILPVDLELPLRDELALAVSLSEVTGTEVDLVRLDTDDPLLHREIALHGVGLFEAEPNAFSTYRANAISRWIVFDEIIAPHRARFLLRLAGRPT
jgi:predicted nucleotidyltransferase